MRRKDYRDQLIEQLLKQNADLADRLQELVGSLHTYQVKSNPASAAPNMTEGISPRWESEAESEVKEMYEDGYIDIQAMQEALAEVGYANTEVYPI